MLTPKKLYLVCCCLAAALLLGGVGLVATYGLTPPPWLLAVELAGFAGVACLAGFTALVPAVLPWLKLRPVKGTLLVFLGITSIYLPPQLLFAGVFLALGIKLVWAEACELARKDQNDSGDPASFATLVRPSSVGLRSTDSASPLRARRE